MSNRDNKREPWEEPIYDTEQDNSVSRSQKRNSDKKGSEGFITLLVILLLAIMFLIGYIFWQQTRSTESALEKNSKITVQTSSSSKESSNTTKDSTKDSAKQSSDDKKSEDAAAKKAAEEKAAAAKIEAEKKAAEEKALADKKAAEEQQAAQQQQAQQNQPVEQEQNEQNSGNTYTVGAGEGLYRVSVNTGVPIETLKQLNGLTSDSLQSGQVLKIK